MTTSATDRYSRAILKELLQGEKLLRRQAEDLRLATRRAVIKLGYELTPELLDNLAKASPTKLQETPTVQLAELITRDVKARLRKLRQQVRRLERKCEQLQTEQDPAAQERLQAENARLRSEIQNLQARIESGRARAAASDSDAALRPALSTSTTVDSDEFEPFADPDMWPDWFRDWVSSGLGTATFRTSRAILTVMGQTGAPLRSAALAQAAPLAGHAKPGGAENRAINRLEKMDLLKKHVATRGRIHPHLLHLTAKGEAAHRLLYGKQPVQQETPQLLKLHSSPDHVYLILETQLLLEDAGFHVERYFEPLPVSTGTYHPDLIATCEGTSIYVEAERETQKDPAARREKWQKAIAASDGELYITVGTDKEIDPILSEVLYIAGQLRAETTIHAFATETVAYTKAEDKKRGWDIFTYEKQYP